MRKSKCLVIAAVAMAGTMMISSCEKMTINVLKMSTELAEKTMNNFEYTDSEELGPVISQEIPTGFIKGISTMGAMQIVFKQDTACTLKVRGNEKSIEAYNISTEAGELSVRQKNGKNNVDKDTPRITLYVTAPSLSELYTEGVGDVKFEGDIAQKEGMTVNISGVGNLDAEGLTCESLEMQINGMGDAEFDQLKCEGNVNMEVRGTGNIEAKVECTDLTMRISGAGTAVLDVMCEYLRTFINGAGNLTLRGECYKLICNGGKTSNINTEELEVSN